MLTNTDCTIFLAEGGSYRLLPAPAVHWETVLGASLDKTGSAPAYGAVVYIPFSSLPADAIPERVTGRDYILRGKVENFSTITDLLKTRRVYTVQRITKFDYGSPAMRHWKVEAL